MPEENVVSPSPVPTPTPTPPQPAQPVQKTKVKFFSYKGRIGRSHHFISAVILLIILLVTFLIVSISVPYWSIAMLLTASSVLSSIVSFGILIYLALLWIFVGALFYSLVAVKRFHDINKSGGYFWALLIPFFNIYLALSLLLECGTEGVNQYGDDPLEQTEDHSDLIARLGKSTVFKLIVTILLSISILSPILFQNISINPQQSQGQFRNMPLPTIQFNSVASTTSNQ